MKQLLMWLSQPLRLWRFRRDWGYLDTALSMSLQEPENTDQQALEEYCWSPEHQGGWLCEDCSKRKTLGCNFVAQIDGVGQLVLLQRVDTEEGGRELVRVACLPANATRSLANFLRGPEVRSAIGARTLNRKGLAS